MLSHAITVFMAFFAIMNPIAGTPVFLSLTSGDDKATTKAVALKSLIVAFVIIFVFSVSGKLVHYLGASALGVITRMMGLILAVIGTQMVVEGVRGAFKLTG